MSGECVPNVSVCKYKLISQGFFSGAGFAGLAGLERELGLMIAECSLAAVSTSISLTGISHSHTRDCEVLVLHPRPAFHLLEDLPTSTLSKQSPSFLL